jgi:hypothetical protein
MSVSNGASGNRRTARLLAGCSAALAISFFVSAAQSGFARTQQACSLRWRTSPSPTIPKGSELLGLFARTPNDVWAVGSHFGKTLIEHWDGARWRIVPSPSAGFGSRLEAVAGTSASSAWAVGGSETPYRAIMLHWNGRRWSSFRIPGDGLLWDVAADGAGGVWAVGDFTARWNGTGWRVVRTAGGSNGVAALGRGRAWAVGDGTLIQRWNGVRWRRVQSPNVVYGEGAENVLSAVDAFSPTDVWAVGRWEDRQSMEGGPNGALIEHSNGLLWRIVRSPQGGFDLTGVAAISTDDVWAVGDRWPSSQRALPLIEHWDGRRWQVVRSPSPGTDGLNDVAAISRTNVWAVGGSGGGEGSRGFILHYGCA